MSSLASINIAYADEQFHSVFQLLEVRTQQRLTDAIELHVLELRKLPADLGSTSADEQAVLRWCKFLAAKTDEEREQIAMIDPEIRQAKTALEQLSKKRMAQRLAEEREIELNHYYNSLARQREEGRAEGEARGHATLVATIERLCQACSIELTEKRKATLATANLDDLQLIVDSIALERVWPE